jgi:hypothetical protein
LPFHNKWDNNQFRYAWGKKLSARCWMLAQTKSQLMWHCTVCYKFHKRPSSDHN